MKKSPPFPRKPKPAPKPEKPRGEALVSTADLMRETGYSRMSISDLQRAAIISTTEKGKWNPLRTLGAMVRRLREKDAGNEDRQRKNKAEADSAELAAMEAAKELCPMSAAKMFWSEARIEVRQTIERASYLTPQQKVKLLAALAALKKKQPEAL